MLPLALQGLGLPLQLAQGGLQGLHALGELLGGGGPLLGEQGFLHGLEPAAVLLQGLGPLLELVLDVRPHLGGEQGAQHVALLLGAGPEQPEEVPLGQDDDLGELFAAQVEQLLRPAADGAFAAALQQDELPLFPAEALVAVPGLGQLGVPVDPQEDGPAEAVLLPLEGEVELHHRGLVLAGAHAAHGGEGPAAPGGPAVQGKAHGVQQGGLPPAGGAGDEKQPCVGKLGEVQLRGL